MKFSHPIIDSLLNKINKKIADDLLLEKEYSYTVSLLTSIKERQSIEVSRTGETPSTDNNLPDDREMIKSYKNQIQNINNENPDHSLNSASPLDSSSDFSGQDPLRIK